MPNRNSTGNPNWTRGVSGNPNGRPKGSKNKLPGQILSRVIDVWDKLEKTKGKSLLEIAKANPEWFYNVFISRMIPRSIDLNALLDIPALENIKELPDSMLAQIVREGIAKRGNKGLKVVKGKVVKKRKTG